MALFQPVNLVRAKIPKPVVLPHGISHGTPAQRHLHTLALAKLGTGKKHRKRRKKKLKAKRRKRTRKVLAKGSRGIKARMAALRAMRGSKKASAPAP